MLKKLSIHGLAIINRNEITFSKGLNVVTGETGAGKSILIRALSLLFGQKASAETVRSGDSHAEITAEFTVSPSHRGIQYIESMGISVEDSDSNGEVQVLIRRVIYRKGRSNGFINDTQVTSSSLKNLGFFLLDILGQAENQKLYDPKNHQSYLDAFLTGNALEDYRETYRVVEGHLAKLRKSLNFYNEKAADRDYLMFRKQELQDFSPSMEDFEELAKKVNTYERNFAKRQSLAALNTIFEGDQTGGVVGTFSDAEKVARSLEDDLPAKFFEQFIDVKEQVQDLAFEISKSLSSVEMEGECDLETLQERLAKYHELMRRHHCDSCKELVGFYEQLQEDLQKLNQIGQDINDSLQGLYAATKSLRLKAKALSAERQTSFSKVRKLVQEELKDLSMPGASIGVSFETFKRNLDFSGIKSFLDESSYQRFEVELKKLEQLGIDGYEKSRILLSTNDGEPMLPLQKIASGGEASRIQLALKKVLSVGANTCVLVFDEIDTGISGKVADAVGNKLSAMATDFQIICISHLAQVACYADNHLMVFKKKTADRRVESKITQMNKKESLQELARLVSGGEITKTSLDHAKTLKTRAAKQRNR